MPNRLELIEQFKTIKPNEYVELILKYKDLKTERILFQQLRTSIQYRDKNWSYSAWYYNQEIQNINDPKTWIRNQFYAGADSLSRCLSRIDWDEYKEKKIMPGW